MSDIFEKITGLNLQGSTHRSHRRYVLGVAIVTFVLGALYLPYSAVLWVITAIKAQHYFNIPNDDLPD